MYSAYRCVALRQWWVFIAADGVVQWPAVTFSERAPTTNPFLTNSKKPDGRHVQRTRQKHGRRSYLSVDIGGDSQSLLEPEPTWSKDRCLLSYNIDKYLYSCQVRSKDSVPSTRCWITVQLPASSNSHRTRSDRSLRSGLTRYCPLP